MDFTAVPANILIVDDNPRSRLALRSVLEDDGYVLVEATSGTEALKFLLEREFAVILLDVVMPVLNGIETARLIRARDKTRHVPIIFVTGVSTDEMSIFSGYSAGAVDYITTPVIPEILKAKIAAFVELYRKSEEIKKQQIALREMEKLQFERNLESERQQHEIEKLRLSEQFLIKEKEFQLKVAQRLADQADQLAQSNAELEQFAHAASHDLREPLNTISYYCELLEWELKDKLDENTSQYLKFARKGAQRLSALITNLLTYSKLKKGRETEKIEEIDLNQLMQNIVANLEKTIQENGAVISYDELPTICGNEFRLEQLFQNLVSNALKYRGERSPEIHLSVDRDGEFWRFCLKDNGIGIEKEYFDHIFGMFNRLHGRGQYEGTGMGLTLCRSVVESYGGKIWVDSEFGKYSKFFWTLPCGERERSDVSSEAESDTARSAHA